MLLQFKRLFHDQSYFSANVIYVQLCKHSWYKKQPQNRKLVELLKYFTALLHEKHMSKIKNSSTDSIQKCVGELIC